jgi:hypothetical protein
MRTRLTVATAVAGTLLATCLVSGSAQATSVPVLKGDATPGIVTLVGRGGGGGGKHARGGGGGRSHANRGGGGRSHANRGGGGGGGKHARGGGGGRSHANRGGGKRHYGGGGKRHYAYRGGNRRRGSYGRYAPPYRSYGYGGGCGWLYRNAIATDSPYWWNRYYECTGYY